MYRLLRTSAVERGQVPPPGSAVVGAVITEQIRGLSDDPADYTVLVLTARSDGLVPLMTADRWIDPATPIEAYLGVRPA